MIVTVVLAVLVVALAVTLAVVLWRQRRADRPVPVAVVEQVEECSAPGCGIEVAGDDLHLIVATYDESHEFGHGAGTSMSAAYCAEHCPGGCTKESEHAA